jgi:hypothetical protein
MQLFIKLEVLRRQQNRLVVILEDELQAELLSVIDRAFLIEVFYALLQVH